MGIELKPMARTLTGVDLSARMLRRAEQRAIYDRLARAEIGEFLSGHTEAYDLVTATDVFIYVGDLTGTFRRVRRSLRGDGLFSFSVEIADQGDVVLRTSGRYAHGADYLRQLAQSEGFSIEDVEPCILRQEYGADIRGLMMSLRRNP
jgi:predicted TPR repeat methyltransferase